jgi:hypothetical protein
MQARAPAARHVERVAVARPDRHRARDTVVRHAALRHPRRREARVQHHSKSM